MRASTILLGGTLGSIALATTGLIYTAMNNPAAAPTTGATFAIGAFAVLTLGTLTSVGIRHLETTY